MPSAAAEQARTRTVVRNSPIDWIIVLNSRQTGTGTLVSMTALKEGSRNHD
jgi:hypothetical protein